MKMKTQPKYMVLLHATLLLYAAVGVFQKLSGERLALCGFGLDLSDQNRLWALIWFAVTVLIIFVYSLLWQQVLKHMPLNYAYSAKGICTLWTALFGVCFFGEALTAGDIIGLIVVLIGVGLVVTDHE